MWFDISYPISKDLSIYPGDKPLVIEQQHFNGEHYNIVTSSMQFGIHIGTHTDAPRHFLPEGKTIENVDIEQYIGICQIVRVNCQVKKNYKIQPEDLPVITAPRLLIDSGSFDYYQPFSKEYATLAPETAQLLLDSGCCLVGFDSPSADNMGDNEFFNHHLLLRNNVAIIEGLNFNNIATGIYEMVAIPLALTGLEASPLRVLVREVNTMKRGCQQCQHNAKSRR